MKINIEIDEKYSQVEVLIMAPKMNEEVQQIINKINDEKKKHVIGVKDDRMYILNPKDIFCFYTENKKIMARTEKDKYEIKDKLYVIEDYLKNTPFIKISKSVIANVDKVKNLEVSFNGTLCITFFDKSQEYVSRKYVTDIKSYLQIGGR